MNPADPIEPEPYDGSGPPPILEGEIVPYVDGIDEQTGRRRRGYNANVDEEVIAAVIRARASRRTLKDIAEEFGVSATTVGNWYRGAVKERSGNAVKAAEERAKLTMELEAMMHEVWRMQRTSPDDLKVQRETWVRIESGIRTIADLNGYAVPRTVRADVRVTETTQQDLELQEMINAAKAKNAAIAAGVEADFREGGQS